MYSFARLLSFATVLLVIASGCAKLRVPAIDPSGERLFSGSATTLDVTQCRDALPKPAFAAGVNPPPLPGPGGAPPCGYPAGSVCPAAQLRDRSYVVMMPGRVVAPVGSEVIVVSGLCDEGRYVKREKLEWLLAPDSVGHILQVGTNKQSFLGDLVHRNASLKIDNDFARTRTNPNRETVTRGNQNHRDDVVLGRGQSWVSVMSPTEGASHVTVVAPAEENWDHRRQTATIYWVDAQWNLPPPQIIRTDRREPAILNTTLARVQNLGPIPGWLVRYEVLDGPLALFENGQRTLEVTSDANGHAAARLTPQSGESGISQVGVQIIRPASSNGDYPRMVVGQGLTSVTWSAPGLVVRPVGPATAEADQPVNYRIEVANTGDAPATNVQLSYKVPDGAVVVSTNPPAQPFGDRLQWRLADVPPRQAPRVVDITLTMRLQARYEHCFTATSLRGDGAAELTASGCVSTIVNRSALVVRMTGPQTAQVGNEIKFLAEIENTSSLPASNINVTDTFTAGLEHISGNPSPLSISNVGTLEPGQKTGVMLTFVVKRPGTHCHRLEVSADGGVKTSTEACVIATAEQAVPRLDIRMTAPEKLRAGDEGIVAIEARNNGTVPLTGLRITNRYSASFFPREASRGFKLSRDGEVFWELDTLPPGETVVFETRVLARRADPSAICVGTITAEPGLSQQAQTRTQIDASEGAAVVPSQPNPAAAARPGNLQLEIVDTNDPAVAGRNFVYQINVANLSEDPDQQIAISFQLPPGMTYVAFRGAPVRTEGATYVVNPIAELRGRESHRPYELEVRIDQPGKYQIQVQARSVREPRGIEQTEETTVIQ